MNIHLSSLGFSAYVYYLCWKVIVNFSPVSALPEMWSNTKHGTTLGDVTKPVTSQSTKWNTVYPKKYAHGLCFAVLCCGYTLTDFPISIRLTSLALWQSNDCPSASKATLMNMDKYFMWIHYERLHNHNKAKHNKAVCIFLGIYCNPSLHDIKLLWAYRYMQQRIHDIKMLLTCAMQFDVSVYLWDWSLVGRHTLFCTTNKMWWHHY